MLFRSPWLAVVALVGCTQIDNPLLGTGGGSAVAGGAAAGGAAGSSATGGGAAGGMTAGGVGGGATGGGAAGGTGCTPSWMCGNWEPDAGIATRSCLDMNTCGTASGKPTEGPVPLPSLDLNFYKCRVQPIVDLTCAMIGCHGREQGRPYRAYARARLRADEPVCGGTCNQNCGVMVSAQVVSSANHHCSGRNGLTALEWSRNFGSARAMAISPTPAQSELLTQPLAGSSFTHAGVKVFTSTADPRYQTLLQWLNGTTLATCVTAPN